MPEGSTCINRIYCYSFSVECRTYCKAITRLTDANFIAPIVKRASSVRKPLPYGTVAIRYNSVELLRQVKSDILSVIEKLV